jgi:hypothetical protein
VESFLLLNISVLGCIKWVSCLDPRLRGDDGQLKTAVIPAVAGIWKEGTHFFGNF